MSDMDNKIRERGLCLLGGTGILPVITGWKPVPLYRTGTVPEKSGLAAEKGFTLIEVLIITAIVGVLTTIAVMNFGGIIDSYKVRGAASNLYADMQMARLRAVKEGKEVIVRFAATDVFYAVTTAGGRIKSVNLSSDYSGVKMCNATNVEFNPNGTTNIGGPGAIISKGVKAQKVYISSSGTGNIRSVTAAVCP